MQWERSVKKTQVSENNRFLKNTEHTNPDVAKESSEDEDILQQRNCFRFIELSRDE